MGCRACWKRKFGDLSCWWICSYGVQLVLVVYSKSMLAWLGWDELVHEFGTSSTFALRLSLFPHFACPTSPSEIIWWWFSMFRWFSNPQFWIGMEHSKSSLSSFSSDFQIHLLRFYWLVPHHLWYEPQLAYLQLCRCTCFDRHCQQYQLQNNIRSTEHDASD